MKKELSVFLCIASVLFFGSCADLSLSAEEATKAELPEDFDWEVYAKINRDVAMSQIILTNKGYDDYVDSIQNCLNLLSSDSENDFAFAKDVYLNYANCPSKGWFQNDACRFEEVGIYAIKKDSISVVIDNETIWRQRCYISGCWRGGWDQISDRDSECTGDPTEDADAGREGCIKGLLSIKTFLLDSLNRLASLTEAHLANPTTTPRGMLRANIAIITMCRLLPKVETQEEALNYLKNFKFDPMLVQKHYLSIGRYDGRPYKYCEQNHAYEEKDQSLAVVYTPSSGATYYDYGKYAFCLDSTKNKVYVIK